MIASWMLYAVLVGVLVAISAAALDRVAAALGRPRRFVWLAAIVAMVAWPVIASVAPRASGSLATTLAPFTVTVGPMPFVAGAAHGSGLAPTDDRILVGLWVIASLVLLARIAAATRALQRARAQWKPGSVDGTAVRMSDDVGPAVVGVRRLDVVVPEWVLSFDASLRALVLRHEEEHRSARDPWLLYGGALAVALMPWSPALWYAARRLRLAVELDCDARVLRAHPARDRYGMLILAIAQRRSASLPHAAAMLSEPTSQLERRILAMRTTDRMVRRTMLGGSLVAAAAIAVACSIRTESPAAPRPSTLSAKELQPNQTYFEFQVEKPAQLVPGTPSPRYPDSLRTARVEGSVLVQFVVGTDGRADPSTFKELRSTDPRFTEAVRLALPAMRFTPAEVGGTRVKQLVQMPFVFGLSR